MHHLFIRTEIQKKWMEFLYQNQAVIRSKSTEIDEQAKFPQEIIHKLVHSGYTSLTLPNEYGGAGLGVYDMVLFQETLACFDAATALSIGWHLGTVNEVFEKKVWHEQTLDFFAKEVLQGALINRIASEKQTGSPSRGGRPSTVAVKKGEYWLISGRKNFATMSPVLTYFLTSAWIEEKQDIGFFLLHKDLEGLAIEETWNTISMRGTASHDVILNQVQVKDEMLVELNRTAKKASLSGWLLHVPACYLGIALAARDYAVEFSKEHKPSSTTEPICHLANVQQLIAEMDLELMKARHFLYHVAEIYDEPSRRQNLTNELGAVKLIATNAAITIVDRAMRIVGAKSLEYDNPLQRHYRNVRSGLHNPPMDNVTMQKIALTAIDGERD